MITATFVKKLDCERAEIDQELWRLSEPVPNGAWNDDDKELTIYVVTSATRVIFTGQETYIFPSNAEGDITNWTEMDGSYRGGLNHDFAITGAGWTVDRKATAQ